MATTFIEFTSSSTPSVDRENGVIRRVKILGRESRNRRTYTEEAIRQAAKFYEGMTVRLNHPSKATPNAERKFEEGFGILKNVVTESDGAYGDLHYLKSHAVAASFAERAERFPSSFGLSHNAEGEARIKDGKQVVESITSVRSVDVVDSPATNSSLFESEERTMKKTIKQIVENAKKETPYREAIVSLLEQDDMAPMADAEVEVEPEASSEDQVKAAFRAMVIAAFDDESLDAKATVDKIKEILKAQEKLMGGGEAPEGESEETEEETEDPAMESIDQRVKALENENKQLKAANHVRGLIESANRVANDDSFDAIVSLESDKQRKAMIELLPLRESAKPKTKRPERSPAKWKGQEAGEKEAATDAKSFLEAITK